MRKIPTLFARDFEHSHGRYVTRDVTPGCEWVLAGEGVATRKFDGVCIRIDEAGVVWSRREIKPGALVPAGFAVSQADPETGKTVGWEPAERSSFYRYIVLGVDNAEHLPPGTYELIGPRINGNAERSDVFRLIPHGIQVVDVDRDYDSLKRFLIPSGFEGLVFWRERGNLSGDMAKIKGRDFL